MWGSYKIFYYQSNKDDLVLKGVVPIIEKLKKKNLITTCYFDRHWLNGPHLKFNYNYSNEKNEKEIKNIVEEGLESYLKYNPSEDIKLEKLNRNIDELAKIEMLEGNAKKIHKNNTFEKSEYNVSTHLGKEGEKFIEYYFSSTRDYIVNLINDTHNDKSKRYIYIMKLMVLLLNTIGDPRRTYLSYRSHSESILLAYDNDKAIRKTFEYNYQKNKSSILSIIDQINKNQIDNELLDWKIFFDDFYSMVQEAVAQNKLQPINTQVAEKFYNEHGVPEKWAVDELSEFHQMFYSQEGIDDVLESAYFKSIRLMFNFLYMNFRQLGFSTLDRIYLCYLIANGIEDFFGVNWQSQFMKSKEDGIIK